ncbi:MAG TPA: hypothetical protein VH230_14355 [Stellaceae bacterium]|jgi:hypothetical protein|nr:hypothetical protein [Stellaceae bacterium]
MPMNEQDLGMLIRILNPYSTDMDYPPGAPPIVSQAEQQGATDQAALSNLEKFQVEVDDYISNYTSGTWAFRGQTQTIKRALRVTYRYPLKDIDGKYTGFYATEHLLIGYAGGNGGG